MNIAIITGASSGMGREYALQCETYFPNLDEIWLIARRKERLEEVAKSIKTKCRILALDLEDEKSFEIIENLLKEDKPCIKLLINDAGHGKIGDYENTSIANDISMIKLNEIALVTLTHMSLQYMDKGSYIIEMGSISSYQPVPYINTYAATKAFVLSYSRALNVELKPRGIRVLCVTPFWVDTEFFDWAYDTNANNRMQYYVGFLKPEKVVKLAYHDLLKTKKDTSTLGFKNKLQVLMVKLFSHRTVMKIFVRQQRKPKNNERFINK